MPLRPYFEGPDKRYLTHRRSLAARIRRRDKRIAKLKAKHGSRFDGGKDLMDLLGRSSLKHSDTQTADDADDADVDLGLGITMAPDGSRRAVGGEDVEHGILEEGEE